MEPRIMKRPFYLSCTAMAYSFQVRPRIFSTKIRDPWSRPWGIEILEIPSLCDAAALFAAVQEGHRKALAGQPCMIYPVGDEISLTELGARYGIEAEVNAFSEKQAVAADAKVWVPGSLMSYRDVESMLECIFLVNGLPGGAGHHDGHMKGRDLEAVLANPMLQIGDDEEKAFAALSTKSVATTARPAPGSKNLELPASEIAGVKLPGVGESDSPRAGTQEAYYLLAKNYPKQFFNVSCDLNPSTKLGKAVGALAEGQSFEMSIEEQVAALMADGLAMSGNEAQLNVFATFAAFFEGIAREGLELWRYQRNLNGVNEGLNVCMHLSHVGACTGRDHFSGWSLDWITLAMGYLPYLHRFYAPADARSAFFSGQRLSRELRWSHHWYSA